MAQYQPDIFILYCGTNDDPNALCYGESCTGWSFRYVVEAVHNYRPANPAWTVATLIGYSDATMAPGWLLTNEAKANDTLYSNFHYERTPERSTDWIEVTDLQYLPGTSQYITGQNQDGTWCDPRTTTCGIHLNAAGNRVVGRLYYDTIAKRMGWPDATTLGEPVLCGLDGHRQGYPRQEDRYLPPPC